MNKFFRKYWKPLFFSISTLVFLCITKLLLHNEIKVFDDIVYSIVSKFRCNTLTVIFRFISFLCSFWFLSFITILFMIFSKNKKRTFYVSLNVLLCFLLNQSFKLFFARPRPVDINLIVETGYSFPSGHSMISLAFYGFFGYMISKKRMKRKKKILYISLLSILIFLIGLSRIYLGVHYASDVMAGFALSFSYLILYIIFFYKKMQS